MDFLKRLIILGLLSISFLAVSQDLSKIDAAEPIKVTGGLNVNQVYNSANSENPYSYYINANLNFDLYGLSIPLSVSYSNREYNLSQPFNQYGLSPVYKWITLHLGYRSLSYSKYGYSGILFNGIGIEANPDFGLRVSAFYGRLQKAIEADSLNGREASFRRMGYGFKTEYNVSGNSVSLSVFKAKDFPNSLSFIPYAANLRPKENLVFTLGGSIKILKDLRIQTEGAMSIFTRDTQFPREDPISIEKYMGALVNINGSSGLYWAGKMALQYSPEKFSLGLNYERINPGYATLGQYYANNDIETISINYGQNLFGDKIKLALSGGSERNNLDKNEAEEALRIVYSTNIFYNATEDINVNLVFSNYRSFTRIQPAFEELNNLTGEPIDTLQFTQVNRSVNANYSWSLIKSDNANSNLNINFSYQGSVNKEEPTNNTRAFNESISYQMSWRKKEIVLSVTLNASQNNSASMRSLILGPSVSINKSFFTRKIRAGFMTGFNQSRAGSSSTNTAIARLTGSVIIKKRHNLNSSFGFSYRNSVQETSNSMTGSLGYSFAF